MKKWGILVHPTWDTQNSAQIFRWGDGTVGTLQPPEKHGVESVRRDLLCIPEEPFGAGRRGAKLLVDRWEHVMGVFVPVVRIDVFEIELQSLQKGR